MWKSDLESKLERKNVIINYLNLLKPWNYSAMLLLQSLKTFGNSYSVSGT